MTLSQIIELSLFVFYMAMIVTIGVQHLHNTTLSREIQDYAAQVDQLHADAIKANSEAVQARITADREIATAKMKASHIMREKVSPDCNSAISWAIKQAPNL